MIRYEMKKNEMKKNEMKKNEMKKNEMKKKRKGFYFNIYRGVKYFLT